MEKSNLALVLHLRKDLSLAQNMFALFTSTYSMET